MLHVELSKVLICLALTQLSFVYSEWWDDYNSQYYYGAYSQMGYPGPYSHCENYDYSSYGQAGYPYNAYLMMGSYEDYEKIYDSYYTNAAQPIIIVVENIDKHDELYLDDLISLSLGLAKDLPSDCSSSYPSTRCNSNSCECRNKGRQNFEFYSECNRSPQSNCDSCRSKSKKGCKKSCKKSECGCHRFEEDSYCDCGCCKHIVICECC